MFKRKLNWLDITLIGVVILGIIAAAWYFTKGNDVIKSNEKTYTVTLRFTKETTDPTDYYKVGDQLFQTNKTLIGEIVGLEEKPLIDEEYNPEKGEYETVTDPVLKQIEMVVKAKGEVKNGVLTVNGEELFVGQKFYPQSLTTRSTMEIWAIQEEAAA